MKVNLLNYTPDPDYTAFRAAKVCYSEQDTNELFEYYPKQETVERFLDNII